MSAPAWPKPVDIGTGTQAASFGLDASWLSLGAAHPQHGYVELSNTPDFDESRRGDPAYVRQYRTTLTDPRHAFLVLEPAPTLVGLDEDGPHWHHPDARHDVRSTISADGNWIVQQHRLTAPPGESTQLTLTFRGLLRRAPFAEITEVAPPPPLTSTTRLRCAATTLTVSAARLGASASIVVSVGGGHTDGWQPCGPMAARLVVTASADLNVVVRAHLAVTGVAPPAGRDTVAVSAGMPLLRTIRTSGGPAGLVVPTAVVEAMRRIAAGAVRYTLDCCVCRVAPGEAAILTDHRLLPLSWTRDAYFQALLLLSVRADVPSAIPTVEDHLRWLWGRARQPGIGWLRAHYAHGAIKDPVAQADQRLYPLLELLDFRRLVGRWPRPPVSHDVGWWGEQVATCWAQLPRHHPTGLLTSVENPADDALDLPLLLSTQILHWYVASWLTLFADELGLDRPDLATASIRTTTEAAFACDGPAGPMWAYAADGTATSAPYADANDLPTALAPLWGFCRPDEPRWTATMRFAFSTANPAYTRGRFGGLGSRHTPGTWPLGDVQEWLAAGFLGQRARAERVLQRIERVASPDGMLPEAYDPDTGRWTARHWFAWPGAALGALSAVASGTLELTAPPTPSTTHPT